MSDLSESSEKDDFVPIINNHHFDWTNWLKINQEELAHGQALAKSREKIASFDEMLKLVNS